MNIDTQPNNEDSPFTSTTQGNGMAVPYFSMFRYSTPTDRVLMWIGAIAALVNGLAFPCFSLIFGVMTDTFTKGNQDRVLDDAKMFSIYYLAIGLSTMILSFIMIATWMITGEKQGIQYRRHYLEAILRQEIGWFDVSNPNELNSKVSMETFAIQSAIGDKFPIFLMSISTTIASFGIAFIIGWKLSIVVTASLPAIAILSGFLSQTAQNSEVAIQGVYSKAGALVEQAINQIKTVKALTGEEYECARYSELLFPTAKTSIKFSVALGAGIGLIYASMLWTYALASGMEQINENTGDVYTVGDILIIFYSILTGGLSLGILGPCLTYFSKGQVAAIKIHSVLDRKPKIINPIAPKSLHGLSGEIVLKDVHFNYPNRPETKILNGINLVIQAGKKVALVGESGCGKSTVMQLIERFYDCDQGQVLFGGQDGIDVRDVLIKELRGKIGMVGQEPVLFATTIRENLLYGNPEATEEQMIEALKKVNAWNFISRMEKKLETYVGIGGGQLSGGQKQRIAIARAILKNPQILLLDEATSALDRTNEKLIQKTLDEVSIGITTIVIAHRLTTIQNADLIYVIEGGQVVEQGNFNELMQRKGKFAALAKNQTQVDILNDDQDKLKQTTLFNPPINNNQAELYNISMKQELIIQSPKFDQVDEFEDVGLNHNKIETIRNQFQIITQEKTKEIIKQDLKPVQSMQLSRIIYYCKVKILCLILGVVFAMLNGCIFPIFSMFLSDIISILVESNPKFYSGTEKHVKVLDVQMWADNIALIFVILGSLNLIFWVAQTFFLSIVGENVTMRLRQELYRKVLNMPISYFDDPRNPSATLVSRLAIDCRNISNLISSILGINIANIGAFICGIIISFTASWQLALIVLVFSPLTYFGGVLYAKSGQGFSNLTDEAYTDSSALLMDVVTNIRTVYSFSHENILVQMYMKKLQLPFQQARKKQYTSDYYMVQLKCKFQQYIQLCSMLVPYLFKIMV